MTIGDFLELQCKAKKVVTYQEVVNAFPDLPHLQGDWNNHPLCGIFETLDQKDARMKRPFRTSVVVKADKQNQMPGSGFFEALERLNKISCKNNQARQAAWITELNAAHNFPWP